MSGAPDIAALNHAARRLLAGDEGATDAVLLLAHVLKRPRAWLYAHLDAQPSPSEVGEFNRLIQARATGVPVAQLIGRRGFWTLDLVVDCHTLIPRPETELLVELALARLPLDAVVDIADLGTGSGAIALALATERPGVRVLATDASADALAVAQANAAALKLGQIEFRRGDWCHALPPDERLTMIVSNPPYLADDDPHLQQGDLRFEPRSALASGVDGLAAMREIVASAPQHLLPGGWLVLEHGLAQGAAVRSLLCAAGFVSVETVQDLEARDRVSLGRWPESVLPSAQTFVHHRP